MSNIQNFNDKLVSLFETKKPFSLVRIGNTEGHFLDLYSNFISPDKHSLDALFFVAGVYPISEDYLINVWMKETLNAIKNSNMVGFVDISENVKHNTKFLTNHCQNKILFFKDDIRFLNPTTSLLLNNPWTKCLSGKKVLVVSSHKQTIEFQWKNIKNVWGDNVKTVTPFDLVGVVRSPFNPECDDRQYENCNTWDDTLNAMYNEISSYDYDILLVGAGAFSPSLASFAKIQGKIGITLCGDIQLLFGILGIRWASYSNDIDKQYWIYPFDVDLPKNKESIERFEKSYWK